MAEPKSPTSNEIWESVQSLQGFPGLEDGERDELHAMVQAADAADQDEPGATAVGRYLRDVRLPTLYALETFVRPGATTPFGENQLYGLAFSGGVPVREVGAHLVRYGVEAATYVLGEPSVRFTALIEGRDRWRVFVLAIDAEGRAPGCVEGGRPLVLRAIEAAARAAGASKDFGEVALMLLTSREQKRARLPASEAGAALLNEYRMSPDRLVRDLPGLVATADEARLLAKRLGLVSWEGLRAMLTQWDRGRPVDEDAFLRHFWDERGVVQQRLPKMSLEHRHSWFTSNEGCYVESLEDMKLRLLNFGWQKVCSCSACIAGDLSTRDQALPVADLTQAQFEDWCCAPGSPCSYDFLAKG